MSNFKFFLIAGLTLTTYAFRSIKTTLPRMGSSTLLNANILETAEQDGNFKTLCAAIKAAGLVEALSGPGPLTVFAPSDAAFAKLPSGTVEGLLKDIPALKRILLYHVHLGKMSPTRNGKTIDTLLMGEDDFAKQLTIKVTNWSCESFIWGGHKNPAFVSKMDVICDNGRIHVVDEVLLPYEGNEPPKITFIGARDATGEKTLQTGYYGDMEGSSPNPFDRYRAGEKFEDIVVGDTWVAAANWDFEKKYAKGVPKKWTKNADESVDSVVVKK
jgi:uncharacterized surface protein with fasciclin (FAS1) repeats